ncbi:MAG: transcriptional repressor AgaR [Acidobacteriaceae bacterium]|nr:transcriptional repressor AgaR [Acidobacteriaceae bacterium]
MSPKGPKQKHAVSEAGSEPVAAAQNMLIGERRQHVMRLLERDGRVLVSELSTQLGISPITIRKDLDYLESKGLVERTHGGALAPQKTAMLDRPLKEKESQQTREKQLIAEAAASLVQEGQCVLLDSGTTTTAVAKELRRFSNLTIVTNALNIAAELSDTDFDIILIGGNLRKNAFSLVGPLAEDVLREIHADILFLGVDGFDVETGITTPSVQEARVNRVMANVSRKVVAVCDSTKFSRRSLALIIPPSAVHKVITDSNIDAKTKQALEAAGVSVVTV